MKTKIILFCLLFSFDFSYKAQSLVTIPDEAFVTWLNNYYPGAMVGNQLNIDNQDIINTTTLNFLTYSYSNYITDFTGLEYFINLTELDLTGTNCNFLPTLTNSLTYFKLGSSSFGLNTLPALPNSIRSLIIEGTLISNIPDLPDSLRVFYCNFNSLLLNLPELPDSLNILYCNNSNLLFLPELPSKLERLYFMSGHLTELPDLPNTLKNLVVWGNLLTSLPTLPSNLSSLSCYDNDIISLPVLPESLIYLNCSNNNISCFPVFPATLVDHFDISNNPFTCLPNYIDVMSDSLLNLPLCVENDFVNNPSGCNPAKGILGTVFSDNNSNCTFENMDNSLNNFSLKLYNESDSLIRQTYSLSNGKYQFPQEFGTYKVEIDTLNQPFSVQCQSVDTIITLISQNILIDSINFALSCKPGFDIGSQSISTNGWVFPGQNHDLKIIAGDLSQWYNMNCAAGVSGELQLIIDGPITFFSSTPGALTPTVSGNVYNYTIPDFGDIDIQNAFGLIFKTDTTAQGGDEICVSINITPTNGDNNMSNNSFEYCYQVVNSYDPNMKEVYPVNVEPGYEDYFTYTIHFQNTGSAPAFNIRLLDTLDENLDLETFQVINYSHFNSTMLKNNILTFHFPKIMLADSTSDLEGSKGFVQYRIKPKANLALGTQIKNTANIYFDFNAPIVTNTTINEYVETKSISEKVNSNIHVFPNPFSTSTTIVFKTLLKETDIKLYNVYGQEVRSIADFSGDKLKIERENLANGVYYLKVDSQNEASETVKLILKN
jgi:uncharacterized repeat protein (TIGR01451 family)